MHTPSRPTNLLAAAGLGPVVQAARAAMAKHPLRALNVG